MKVKVCRRSGNEIDHALVQHRSDYMRGHSGISTTMNRIVAANAAPDLPLGSKPDFLGYQQEARKKEIMIVV